MYKVHDMNNVIFVKYTFYILTVLRRFWCELLCSIELLIPRQILELQ